MNQRRSYLLGPFGPGPAILAALALAVSVASAPGAVIWTGPTTTFSKTGFADHTLEANQDRITDSVWLTRASTRGLFNIASEAGYSHIASPTGTQWAFGNLEDWATLSYTTWGDLTGYEPPDLVNQDAVVHLVADDIYIGIKFLSWTVGEDGGGPGGGGFSYERTTAAAIPEPATTSVVVGAVALAGAIARRRRRR